LLMLLLFLPLGLLRLLRLHLQSNLDVNVVG
jgi:hypothetical protein